MVFEITVEGNMEGLRVGNENAFRGIKKGRKLQKNLIKTRKE